MRDQNQSPFDSSFVIIKSKLKSHPSPLRVHTILNLVGGYLVNSKYLKVKSLLSGSSRLYK